MQKNRVLWSSKMCTTIIIAGLLSACGGGGNTGQQQPDPGNAELPDPEIDYDLLETNHSNTSSLEPIDSATLETLLKNGLRVTASSDTVPEEIGQDLAGQAQEFDLENNNGSAFSFGIDDEEVIANVVVGDESLLEKPDIIKFDGENIFMATSPQYCRDFETEDKLVRILQTDPLTAQVEEVGFLPYSDDAPRNIDGLYTSPSSLITVSSGSKVQFSGGRGHWGRSRAHRSYDKSFSLNSYDITDPSTPTQIFSVEIDGKLVSNIKIGDIVYLVAQHAPEFPYSGRGSHRRRDIEDELDNMDLDDFIPGISINGEEKVPLVNAEDCLAPADSDGTQGYANLITVIALDFFNQTVASTACVNAHIQGVYNADFNVYLGASVKDADTNEKSTVIHKLSLNDGIISYHASASIEGGMSWKHAGLRMDEYNDSLRVFTTQHEDDFAASLHLYTFDADMNLIGELPNDINPDPIGNPNSYKYAVSFSGEKAFLVSGIDSDPLYIVDLSFPESPSVASSLALAGKVQVLHEVNDTYQLSVGKNINTDGEFDGLKISLLNLFDLSAPSIESELVIADGGQAWAEATSDLRALTIYSYSDDEVRFAFSVSQFSDNSYSPSSALHLFEATGLSSGAASISAAGELRPIQTESRRGNYWRHYFNGDRSIIEGESVFYLQERDVYSALWIDPETVFGPF